MANCVTRLRVTMHDINKLINQLLIKLSLMDIKKLEIKYKLFMDLK
nr:PTS transporter subunit EIIB [Mycoplasma capricolum]